MLGVRTDANTAMRLLWSGLPAIRSRGVFLDIKNWPEIKDPKKNAGKELFIGSATDPYLPQEKFMNAPEPCLYS